MNELAIDILYDYMVHVLKVKDSKELEDAANLFQDILSEEQYYELEPHINSLIGLAEKEGFRKAILLFVNTPVNKNPIFDL